MGYQKGLISITFFFSFIIDLFRWPRGREIKWFYLNNDIKFIFFFIFHIWLKLKFFIGWNFYYPLFSFNIDLFRGPWGKKIMWFYLNNYIKFIFFFVFHMWLKFKFFIGWNFYYPLFSFNIDVSGGHGVRKSCDFT